MDIRRRGGGGKKRVAEDTTLVTDLLALVEPDARGDPMSPLRWTCKSLSQLTRALVAKGHRVGRTLVGKLLHQQNSVCKPIARRARERATPIAMRSSLISTRACEPHWQQASR
jgi:Rhodopirellula transposase DDE domain